MSEKNIEENEFLKRVDRSVHSFQKLEESEKYLNSIRAIRKINEGLSQPDKLYNPAETISILEDYVMQSESQHLTRLLYSEISAYIFGLDDTQRGIYLLHTEKLMLYTLNLEDQDDLDDEDEQTRKISKDARKLAIKIYDHSNLANGQIENAKNIYNENNTAVKESIQNELKGIEKEYITILGIFAAIVLAFVGGITFSSSVLENIQNASIYRLFLTVDFLAFVLLNIISLLMRFIFNINDKNDKPLKILWYNVFLAAIAAVVIILWIKNGMPVFNP